MELFWGRAFHDLLPNLLGGIGVVLYVTLIGFAFALLVALLLALGRISKKRVLNVIIVFFLEIIRGTPLLVQFFYIYYVVPILLNALCALFGSQTNIQISPTLAGIIGFAINYGCYMSEVVRSAINSIDKGQREAGLALGFSETQVLFKFIIPPAIRNSVPVFGNYLVMMIKDTSLLAMISVSELLLRTRTYASQTFLTVESYTILALVYLIISVPLSRLAAYLEKRMKKPRIVRKAIENEAEPKRA